MSEAVQRLRSVGELDANELARRALQQAGEAPTDETVPTAEGVTFFKGRAAAEHAASGSDKTLLQIRVERIRRQFGSEN